MGPGGEGWGPGVPGAFPFVSLYIYIRIHTRYEFFTGYSRTLQSRIMRWCDRPGRGCTVYIDSVKTSS